MRLLGVQLSGSGLPFVRAGARHQRGQPSTAEVVVPTEDDAAPMAAWLERNGWADAVVRVATAEELADMKQKPCEACDNHRDFADTVEDVCGRCWGKGVLDDRGYRLQGQPFFDTQPCPTCAAVSQKPSEGG